ncbi:hypothetical protein B0H11DRAFT_1906236 [Mycena galericulata]|nr:hypothetical protein B0H11DRAFT_1906236 [Mycena galericulata]
MSKVYNDDKNWVEDRYTRGRMHPRKTYGYWTGDVRAATYVHPLGASLQSPPPPFAGFAAPDATGDDPVDTLPPSGAPGTAARETPADRKAGSSYTPDTHSASGSSRDYDRHYESPRYREDVLRHEALTSRDRFRDEPYWGSRPRYPPREDRDAVERERLRDYHRSQSEADRTRAREVRVARERGYAPQPPPPHPSFRDSRRGDQSPRRIIESPDLRAAPRGRDGHPQSPWAIARADPDFDESDDDVHSDVDYVNNEEGRISRVRSKAPRADSQAPALRPRDSRLEDWQFREICSIEQARNFVGWLSCGQQGTYEKLSFIVSHASARPLEFRTEGEAYLLRYQQDLDRTYWTAATGAPRAPRAQRHPNIHDRRLDDPPHAEPSPTLHTADAMIVDEEGTTRYQWGSTGESSGTASTSSTTPAPPARTMPPNPAFATAGRLVLASVTHIYLGESRPNPADTIRTGPDLLARRPNTQASLQDGVRYYSLVNPARWGTGLLNAQGRIPTHIVGEQPLRSHVRSYHTQLGLAPTQRRGSSHQFHVWYAGSNDLFSIQGLFNHIAKVGGYLRDNLAMDHWPGPADNVTFPLIVAWYMQHGIYPGSSDVEQLETFSRARRNISTGVADLDNTTWNTIPRSFAEASETMVPNWPEILETIVLLTHPVLPNPATTAADAATAAGIAASMHAPMIIDPVEELSASGIRIITETNLGTPEVPDPPSDSDATSSPTAGV